MANEFAIAEGRRIEITQEQAKQIRDMYQSIRQDFAKEVQSISHRTNISSVMRTQYLNSFQKDLESEITVLNARLEGLIKSNTLEIARAVVLDSDNLAKEMGFNGIFTNEYYIPNQVVNDLISGRLYEGKWSLSQAIWSDNQKKLSDIDQIIATGVAENKSTYDIAKDLERYVNPNARKDWSWSKVYPGSNKVVDYNAQRLARTMVSHAYQESFVQSTKDNPFIESYRWLASGGDRMCELCAERDGQIFAKDELPMDHPNGMCTFEVVIEQSYEDIARSLHDWINDEGDPELNEELDNYAETLGYNVKAWTGNSEQVRNIENANMNLLPRQENLTFLSNMNDLKPDASYIEYQFEKMSQKWGVSVEEVKDTLTNVTRRMVEENDIGICINPDLLPQVLNEGFKNQFQVGTSSGVFNPELRIQAEQAMFGISKNAADDVRPVYASLMPRDMTVQANKEYFIVSDATGVYGNACCILRKEAVINNASITIDDSLNNYDKVRNVANVVATPLNDIKISSIGSESAIEMRYAGIDKVVNGSLGEIMPTGTYFEVQIYGEEAKSASSIERVLFKRNEPSTEIKDMLDKMNIPWEVISDD